MQKGIFISTVLISFSFCFPIDSTAENNCRFSTYKEMAMWRDRTTERAIKTNNLNLLDEQGWGQQYSACGLSNLPGKLEYEFNNNKQGDYSHVVFSMRTNSHKKLSDTQKKQKMCSQLLGQIKEYKNAIDQLDLNHDSHSNLHSSIKKGLKTSQRIYNSDCR